MKQSNFSISDVFTVLTAFIFGFISYLSMNFYTLGDVKKSIFFAVIVTLLLVVTALGAKLLKRTNGSFKRSLIFEILLLLMFTSLMILFTIAPFSHFFSVTENKTDIQNELNDQISQAENMYNAYESYAEIREYSYKKQLKRVVKGKRKQPNGPREYKEYGFVKNGVPDNKQIKNKMLTVHYDLFPSNYLKMKENDSIWLSESRKIVDNWKPIGIVNVVNKVEENSKLWLKQLINLSKVREKGEQTEDFTYPLSFKKVKGQFIDNKNPNMISIGLAFLAYILMLFSWFVTKRSTKFPGVKFLFGKGGSVCKGHDDVGEIEL